MKTLLYIISIIIITIAYFSYNIHYYYEPNKTFKNLNNNCTKIRGDNGIDALEDLIHYGKYIIGSSDDRLKYNLLAGVHNLPDGVLALIDTYLPIPVLLKIQIENFPTGIGFHPHGLYLYKNTTLYVINHAYNRGGERVEVLHIESSTDSIKVSYLRTVQMSDEFAGIMNDLAVVGDNDEFYISAFLPFQDDINNGRNPSKLQSYLSYAFIGLSLKFTFIHYCKGSNCVRVPGTGSLENNGVTFDNNNTLYVANVIERKIRVFTLNRNDMSQLIPVTDIKLDYAVDNLDYDPISGIIYAGVIGSLHEQYNFSQEIIKNKKHATYNYWCGALKVDTRNNNKVTLISMQKDQMYAISCAVEKNGYVYMSSWIDNGILVCKLSQ